MRLWEVAQNRPFCYWYIDDWSQKICGRQERRWNFGTDNVARTPQIWPYFVATDGGALAADKIWSNVRLPLPCEGSHKSEVNHSMNLHHRCSSEVRNWMGKILLAKFYTVYNRFSPFTVLEDIPMMNWFQPISPTYILQTLSQCAQYGVRIQFPNDLSIRTMFDRTKTELKRRMEFVSREWIFGDDMEHRAEKTNRAVSVERADFGSSEGRWKNICGRFRKQMFLNFSQIEHRSEDDTKIL